MQPNGTPNIKLFDIDAGNVNLSNTIGYIEQMGFLLCRQGSISLILDNRIYDVGAGDLYIYPAFTHTQIKSFTPDLQGVAGTADFEFVLSALDSIADTKSHIYIRCNPRVSLTTKQYGRIADIIACVRARKDEHTPLGGNVLSSLIRALCCEIVDAYISNTHVRTMKQTRKDKTFQNFIVSLYANFRTRRDVGYYAEQQNLTPRYFTTLIREVSGKTPLQWITMFVIIEAKRLLANPNISIKEVSDRLNFSAQTLFGRYFKLYAGCSPSAYRASAGTNNGER
ncbi:MAG: helix-turn-helix domain-containing protein [Alistipes sp.]